MPPQVTGLVRALGLLRARFTESFDESLVRDYLSRTERYESLPLLGAGAVFEARLMPSGLVLKVAHDGLEQDEIYRGKWIAALSSMQSAGGETLGWPIYRLLSQDGRLGWVTLALEPGLASLDPQWGSVKSVQLGVEEALRARGLRLTDSWQWGTCEGLPFLMDLSDLEKS